MSLFSIVDKINGNLMFKKENSNMQFLQSVSSIKEGKLRKFPYLLKLIFKNKLTLGVDIVVDIENSFEQIEYETEETDILTNHNFILNGNDINGEKYTNTIDVNDIRKILKLELIIQNFDSINGNFNVEIQYSYDKNKWYPYDNFSVEGKNNSDKKGYIKFESNNIATALNDNIYLRLKVTGNANINTTDSRLFNINIYGEKVLRTRYNTVEDIETDIFVTEEDTRSLNLTRSLLHKEGFYGNNVFEKRNQKQIVKLKLKDNTGYDRIIVSEIYTEDFISNIQIAEPITTEYYFFENYDFAPPRITIPSQAKQLLFHREEDDIYLNKRTILNTIKLNDFGFQIIEGIKIIDNDNKTLEKIILDNLDKINVRLKTNFSFSDVLIEKDFDIVFSDVSNKTISSGILNYDDNNDNNMEVITDKIKNHKTFYKLSVIIYNEYSDDIETVLKALKAGNETPQTVFLVNTAPNDSNIENCVFDKTTLGQNVFYNSLVEACNKHIGLQFNSQEELFNTLDNYINNQIATEQKISVTNAVGINFYNFTEINISQDYMNRYGYYVNTVNKKVDNLVKKVRTIGESTNNSIHDKVQFDIGTPFNIIFDITDCLDYDSEGDPINLTNEIFVENDDKSKSLSLTHTDNIFWKYIVGTEEIQLNNNEYNKNRYSTRFVGEKEEQYELSVTSNFVMDLKYRGLNTLTLNVKNKNGIISTFHFEFIVDYEEPEIDDFYIKTTDKITETSYTGKKDLEYTQDNFFEVGLRLKGNYDFYDKGYKIVIFHKNNPNYKIERMITESFISKTFNFHIDDIKNTEIPTDKIKFGEWECQLVRIDYNYAIKKVNYEIKNTILDVLELAAEPVSPDYEDFENNGLQQGKDVYVRAFFYNSLYFTKIRDFLYFCKEVKFIVNNINFTTSPEYFTYSHDTSLESVTSHIKKELDERTELRWFISGSSDGASNEFLNPIANLEGNEKKIKKIKVQFIMYDQNKIIETNVVTVGETGKVTAPILLGSDRHFTKLKLVEAKTNGVTVDQLTEEQIKQVKEKMDHLAELNYSNQQIVNNTKIFVFYSYLAELQFDFGICEYYTVTQNDNTTDLIPITRDGKIRYVLEADGIDENSKTRLTVKGYIKLADGKTLSSEEVTIDMYRKKYPSMINTGNDYTRYVLYKEEDGYYKLQTLIQSKIELDNLNGLYSSEWMKYIKVDLVDIDKRTVIASAPNVVFYDGFIPQTVVFDTGITQDELNKLCDSERLEIDRAVEYKEIEKILNEKIFSTGKHLGQTFYLRFCGVESYLDAYNQIKEIKGKDSFYPVNFEEALKGIMIAPSSGVIVVKENDIESYYTYKNKVNFVVESNNAEYYMYRTDRTAAFQKIYPSSIGTSKIVRITMSTYEVGNHILEIKQQAPGETESNVYSVIVEKIQSPTPPKITGYEVTDENPEWVLYPVESADKYNTYIISDEVEHSKKTLNKLQYEVTVEPEKYLDNGYHLFVAESVDKIGNESDESYFITRKISTPVCSTIEGPEKTSDEIIVWKWSTQYNEGVRNYEIEINGIDKITIPASTSGYNEYHLRFFQGKALEDGIYEIRVWAINELGHKSFKYSSFITEKGSKIKDIVVEFYKYKDDYTNKLEAKVIKKDKAVKTIEYQIFSNNNGVLKEFTDIMSTDNDEFLFLDKNGIKLEIPDGTYYFAFRGVNYIGEKTEFVKTPFIFKSSIPDKPFIYYQKSVKTTNPIFFVKENGGELIEAIEIKIGEHSFEKVRNNAWRPNYSLERGVNNIVFRLTDYAGNQAEYTDFVEVTSSGVNLFQESYKADMNNPVVKLDFNLSQMSNFGHNHFKLEQINLGIETIIDIKNANLIEIPLTTDNNKTYPDGIYTFSIKLYDSLTNDYDYIADYFAITIDSNKPLKPYFLNNGYDNIEYNKNYTKNKSPKWIWQTKDVSNLKEYIVDLYILDEQENNYVEYGNKQFNNYSTGMSGQFQSNDEFKDGTYKLTVKSIGLNELASESESFIFVIKNSLPKPPYFDTTKMINRKYESKNTGITWLWEDHNTGNDKLVKYKIKINDEEFSDEIDGSINYYKETRQLPEGANKITVIGCDKAGNWSSSNEINANNLGENYLYNIKIIDTKIPEELTEEDIKVRILDSDSFEVFFKNDFKSDEYFMFELFSLSQNNEEVLFVKGNTLPLGTENVYFQEIELVPGVNVGELSEDLNTGYCSIRDNTTEESMKADKSLYFTNLPNNIYYLRIYGIDYSGNISKGLVKEIEIQDITKLVPQFISPKEFYTNNSTIIFQWILDQPNILKWEYQLVTPYNNSSADLASEEKWKQIDENIFTINNIPKIIAGNDADGDYTLYVRAIFNEKVIQEETKKEINKRSDIGSITVNLDRKIPQGIIFTNKHYTSDPSVLKWSWNYTGEGDIAAGVYVSFNPNLPLEEWEKLESTTTYSSFKERQEGVYTLYVRTYDRAGNINETIFSNSITFDKTPPFKPIISGGSHIYANYIPTISWENDNNYFKYAWLVLILDEWNEFKELYDKLTNIENYTFTNDDWAFLFSKNRDNINLDNVNNELKELDIDFMQNELLSDNEVTINSTETKYGISAEGEYVFLLSGFDQNNNWAEEFEYQFITYDITAPNVSLMRFTSPIYTITDERRPKWEWEVPYDVTRCKYSLEKNGYDDGSTSGTITKELNRDLSMLTYSFTPEYNLTKGNYRLIVDCYDSAENVVRITKNVVIEDSSSELESDFFDIILPGENNILRCKMNKYSDVYVIVDSTLDKNSVFTYKKSTDKISGFKVYTFGKDELNINEEYDFNLTTYSLKTN